MTTDVPLSRKEQGKSEDNEFSIHLLGQLDPNRPNVRLVDFAAIEDAGPSCRVSQNLINGSTGSEFASIFYVTTPPGGSSPEGFHSHPYEQMYFGISGTLRIELEGESFSLQPGELIVFSSGTRHRAYNDSNDASVALIMTPKH